MKSPLEQASPVIIEYTVGIWMLSICNSRKIFTSWGLLLDSACCWSSWLNSSFLFQLLPQSSKARFYFPLGFVDIFLFVLHTLNHYVPIGIIFFLLYTINNYVPIASTCFSHTLTKFTRVYDDSVLRLVVIPTLIWHINPLNLHINIGKKYYNILALFILCWKLSMTPCIWQRLLWTNQQRLPVIKEGHESQCFPKSPPECWNFFVQSTSPWGTMLPMAKIPKHPNFPAHYWKM